VAKQGKPADLVTPQERPVSNVREIAALVAVLERMDVLTQQEVLEEIKRLREKTVKAR
jgi:hypothetical protein